MPGTPPAVEAFGKGRSDAAFGREYLEDAASAYVPIALISLAIFVQAGTALFVVVLVAVTSAGRHLLPHRAGAEAHT